MVECMDKGLARLDFTSQLPRPGGEATVLTKRGPVGSGCYSPLISDNLPISYRDVNDEIRKLDLASQQRFLSPRTYKGMPDKLHLELSEATEGSTMGGLTTPLFSDQSSHPPIKNYAL